MTPASTGHDIGSTEELADQQARPYLPGVRGMYQRGWDLNVANTLRWRDLPKPTIAQVHGVCRRIERARRRDARFGD